MDELFGSGCVEANGGVVLWMIKKRVVETGASPTHLPGLAGMKNVAEVFDMRCDFFRGRPHCRQCVDRVSSESDHVVGGRRSRLLQECNERQECVLRSVTNKCMGCCCKVLGRSAGPRSEPAVRCQLYDELSDVGDVGCDAIGLEESERHRRRKKVKDALGCFSEC